MAWYKCGAPGGVGTVLPKMITGKSANRGSLASLSYEFTESGTFQYYVFVTSNSAATSAEVSVTLAGSTLTPTFYVDSGSGAGWYYGEVTASSGDTIMTTNEIVQTNRGMQLFILKDSDISKFQFLGLRSNNGQTFSLKYEDIVYLQSYQWGYYSGNNVFTGYQLGVWSDKSIATPNEGSYWYGGTWAIQVA